MLPKRTRAFPVGAKRSVPSAFICGDFKKALTTVVLPVPAGPASTERRLLQNISNAFTWSATALRHRSFASL